jgi:hypothetical protein
MTGPPRRRRSAGAAATWAITGSKLPSRSRGTSISTGPVAALSTVFGRDPLRTLADSRPPGSPVLLMTQVLGHLLVQRGLEDVLGELLKQPIRPGQRQPPIASQLEELPGRLGLSRALPRWTAEAVPIPASWRATPRGAVLHAGDTSAVAPQLAYRVAHHVAQENQVVITFAFVPFEGRPRLALPTCSMLPWSGSGTPRRDRSNRRIGRGRSRRAPWSDALPPVAADGRAGRKGAAWWQAPGAVGCARLARPARQRFHGRRGSGPLDPVNLEPCLGQGPQE